MSMDQILDKLAEHVRERPDDICLAEGDDSYSFAEVAVISDNLAMDLLAAGAEVNDVVAWIGTAGASRLLTFLATQKAGLAFGAPIMQMGPAYIADYMTVCSPKLIVVETGWEDHVPATAPLPAIRFEPDLTLRGPADFGTIPEDVISHISFTSGSTGRPKGMARNRAAMAYFIRQACRLQALGPEDTVALLETSGTRPCSRAFSLAREPSVSTHRAMAPHR